MYVVLDTGPNKLSLSQKVFDSFAYTVYSFFLLGHLAGFKVFLIFTLWNTEKHWWSFGDKSDPFSSGVIHVKRKVGACSYVDDPVGCQSLLSRAMHKVVTPSYTLLLRYIHFQSSRTGF